MKKKIKKGKQVKIKEEPGQNQNLLVILRGFFLRHEAT